MGRDAADHLGRQRPRLGCVGEVAHVVLPARRCVEVQESDRAIGRVAERVHPRRPERTQTIPARADASPRRAARSERLQARRTCRRAARGDAEAVQGILEAIVDREEERSGCLIARCLDQDLRAPGGMTLSLTRDRYTMGFSVAHSLSSPREHPTCGRCCSVSHSPPGPGRAGRRCEREWSAAEPLLSGLRPGAARSAHREGAAHSG